MDLPLNLAMPKDLVEGQMPEFLREDLFNQQISSGKYVLASSIKADYKNNSSQSSLISSNLK